MAIKSKRKIGINWSRFGALLSAPLKIFQYLGPFSPMGPGWGAVFFMGVLFGSPVIALTVGSYFKDGSPATQSLRAKFEDRAKGVTDKNKLYRVGGVDSIIYAHPQISPRQTNIYNFSAKTVMVEHTGKTNCIFTFSEYDNPEDIARARETGCSTADNAVKLVEEFKPMLESDNLSENEVLKKTRQFSLKHCTKQAMNKSPIPSYNGGGL